MINFYIIYLVLLIIHQILYKIKLLNYLSYNVNESKAPVVYIKNKHAIKHRAILSSRHQPKQTKIPSLNL